MHNYIFYLIFLLSISMQKSDAQNTYDTLKLNGIPNNSYDNFKNKQLPTSAYLIVRNKNTGKILFETNINNGKCIECYDKLTNRADSFYLKKDFSNAILLYSTAFKLNDDKGKVKHRLNSACCYVQLNDFNSAFEELNRIVFVGKFYNAYTLTSSDCLKPLQKDARWKPLLDEMIKNIESIQKKLETETNTHQ